jgi:hypothetical protein
VYDYYSRSKVYSREERIAFSIKNRENWSLPWITNVAVLGTGVLNCSLVPINSQPQPCYFAYRTETESDHVDAYGFVERSILMDLLLGYLKTDARDALPALTDILFLNSAARVDGQCYMPLFNGQITHLGWGTDDKRWLDLTGKSYTPQRIVRRKKRKPKQKKSAEEK